MTTSLLNTGVEPTNKMPCIGDMPHTMDNVQRISGLCIKDAWFQYNNSERIFC